MFRCHQPYQISVCRLESASNASPAAYSQHLPLHVQSWRVAASNVGNPTQTRPRPQTCLDVPQAALVQGPANCAVAATAKVKMVAMIEVCILVVVGLARLVVWCKGGIEAWSYGWRVG